MQWAVVVPVKDLEVAKSRLTLPGGERADLALAMALDVVAACLACPAVALTVVVTNDRRASNAAAALGATVIPDLPDAGLNPALADGARAARDLLPDAGVAALSADLPAVTPEHLAEALLAAEVHDRALVSDTSGRGTTLLTARAGVDLAPAYGRTSRDAHVEAGAVELDASGWPGLRRDVDTLEDLAVAYELGIGEHTTRHTELGRDGEDDTVRSANAALATIHGRPFTCTVCQEKLFEHRRAKLNTGMAEFLGFAWADRSADCLVCDECGYVHWFLDAVLEMWSPGSGYPD